MSPFFVRSEARSLPFDYLDKACFAATFAPWASFAPTWRLIVHGALAEPALVRACGWLTQRYPLLASRVVSLDGPIGRASRFAWELDPEPDPGRLFRVLDLRATPSAERDGAEQACVDRFLDLERDYPFALTWVRHAEDRGALFLQQHHALADGRAFMELCRDFVRLVDAAMMGAGPPLPLEPVPRRAEAEVSPERGFRRAWAFARGAVHVAGELLWTSVARSTPLRCNAGADYTGRNRTRFVVLPASRLDGWREGRTRLGLSSNDLLAAALSRALSRWSERHGLPPGRTRLLMPIDVRPREGGFVSFANHLSSVQVTIDLAVEKGLLPIARRIARHFAWANAAQLPRRKLLFESAVMKRLRIDTLRRKLFEDRRLLTSYSFSNLIPLGTPERWRGESFEVEGLRITTPCTPPQGANTTVVRYGGELCFNFNYKDSVLEPGLVEDLCATFEEALAEADAACA